MILLWCCRGRRRPAAGPVTADVGQHEEDDERSQRKREVDRLGPHPEGQQLLDRGQVGPRPLGESRQPWNGGVDRRTDRSCDQRPRAPAEHEGHRLKPTWLSNEPPRKCTGDRPGHRGYHHEADVGTYLGGERRVGAGQHGRGVRTRRDSGPQRPEWHPRDHEGDHRDAGRTKVASGRATFVPRRHGRRARRRDGQPLPCLPRRRIRLAGFDSRIARRPGCGPVLGHTAAGACARLIALATARRDAVTMLPSMPTPHRTRPPTATSRKATALASAPAPIACSL